MVGIEIPAAYDGMMLMALAVLALVFLFWLAYLQISLGKMKQKNKEFFVGGKVKNLEELLLANAQNLKALDKDIQELYNISNQINALSFRGFHKIGLVRYNPFKDVGGDQSFALAMLNGKNNGVTLNSLYTRDGSRVYAKSIVGGKSDKHPLTDEEKQAIELAMKEPNKKKLQDFRPEKKREKTESRPDDKHPEDNRFE